MKTTLLQNLKEGDTFKLFSDGCVWELKAKRPVQYAFAYCVSSGRITCPMNPLQVVIVL